MHFLWFATTQHILAKLLLSSIYFDGVNRSLLKIFFFLNEHICHRHRSINSMLWRLMLRWLTGEMDYLHPWNCRTLDISDIYSFPLTHIRCSCIPNDSTSSKLSFKSAINILSNLIIWNNGFQGNCVVYYNTLRCRDCEIQRIQKYKLMIQAYWLLCVNWNFPLKHHAFIWSQ